LGTNSVGVTFTPSDAGNYNTVSGSVDVVVLPTAPNAPTGLSATPSVGQVSLGWVASPSATSYRVKRANVSGGSYSLVGSPTGTNYVDSVANGATYYYVVSAVNAGGEGSNSSEVSAKLLHVVPFAEDFEGLSIGSLHDQNSWVASNVVVQTNITLDAQAASITQEVGFVQQEFAGASSNVWTDFEIQPVFCAEPPDVDADSTVNIHFNTNGNPVVFNGTNIQVISSMTVTNGTWIQVSVHSDYLTKKWDLYINGASVATDLDFYNNTVSRYEKLKISGGGASGAYVDDITIDLVSPFGNLVTLTMNSLYGTPYPMSGSTYVSNTVVDASLSGSPIIMGSTQYVCTGWSATGSAAASGSTTNTTFSITEDTTLTWQWTTNYWVDVSTAGE
jgi:hypothetical protein